MDEPLTEKELERLRMSVNRQAPFGDATWQMKICKEFGLWSTMKTIGSPKKKKESQA